MRLWTPCRGLARCFGEAERVASRRSKEAAALSEVVARAACIISDMNIVASCEGVAPATLRAGSIRCA